MHPHHRPSEADGIDDPVPGLLSGGPNPGMQDKCQYPSAEPELAYEFINFILSPEIQQQLAEQGVDAPVNTAVTLTPEQAALWTYGADVIAGLQSIDSAKLNAAKGGWVDRWNEIFGM